MLNMFCCTMFGRSASDSASVHFRRRWTRHPVERFICRCRTCLRPVSTTGLRFTIRRTVRCPAVLSGDDCFTDMTSGDRSSSACTLSTRTGLVWPMFAVSVLCSSSSACLRPSSTLPSCFVRQSTVWPTWRWLPARVSPWSSFTLA